MRLLQLLDCMMVLGSRLWILLLQLRPAFQSSCHLQHNLLPVCIVLLQSSW
jgi:hypothetical protein